MSDIAVVEVTALTGITAVEVAPVGPIFVDVVIGTSIEVIETETVLAPAAVDVLIPGLRGPKGEKGDPGTSMVSSVNGMVGDVVLDAEDVQADPEGTALAAASASMAAHLADPDPHGQYLVDGDTLDAGNF